MDVIIDICHRLDECLDKARSLGDLTSFNAAAGFVDHNGLSYVLNYLDGASDVKIVVGDLGPVPRVVYERWRDVIKVYPDLHAKLYLFGNGVAVVGSANLTAGGLYGNVELNLLIRGELYDKLARYFEELWRSAKPLTEDYVEDVEEVEARRGAAKLVDRVNEALAKVLKVDKKCLAELQPTRCPAIVAEAVNKGFRTCRDLPENCVVEAVAGSLGLRVAELARRLMRGPDSAIVAGHPLCWAKAFAAVLRAGRVKVDELSSGVKIYEAMVKVASRECPGRAGEAAGEELARLSNEDYKDDYVRWKIPARLLPLALVLPVTGCRLAGVRRAGGTVLRRLDCGVKQGRP